MKEDDINWPEPDRIGRQELEIVMGNEHISFTTSKIGSLVDVQSSKDPEGLRIFYYLVQVCPQPHIPPTAAYIVRLVRPSTILVTTVTGNTHANSCVASTIDDLQNSCVA